jgi:hypothetical protein
MLRAAVITLLMLVAGCASESKADDDGTEQPSSGPTTPFSEPPTVDAVDTGLLSVTSEEGNTYEFTDATVECRKSDAGGAQQLVLLTAPANFARGDGNDKVREPFVYVQVIAGIDGSRELPIEGPDFGSGDPDVGVFVLDPADQNELSSAEDDAAGQITIIEASCDPTPRLAFTIDATLGSEVGLPAAAVTGGLEADDAPN